MKRPVIASIAARRRSAAADARLGVLLAAVAGLVDAAGFVLAQRYTSHMTGVVAAAGDEFAAHAPGLALASVGAVLAFVAGSASCTLLVRFARLRRSHAPAGWSLLGEAAVLALAAIVPVTAVRVVALCFAMGWQNALAAKVSRSEIRTTHVTGIVTDIGIGVGRLAARRLGLDAGERHGPVDRLALLGALLAAFLVGTIAGAWAALHAGALALLLPAAVLVGAGAMPLQVELLAWRRRLRAPRESRAP
ncbi:MAG: YoaK family protein [Burkholderiaceae bacterium]